MNSTIYNEIYSKISNLGLDKPDRFIYREQNFYDNTPFGTYVIKGTPMNSFREEILKLSKNYSNEFGENLIHQMTQARIIEPSYYISVYDTNNGKQLIFNLVKTIITEFPNIKNKSDDEINNFIKNIYNRAINIVNENKINSEKIYNETIKNISEMETSKTAQTKISGLNNIWLQMGANKIK